MLATLDGVPNQSPDDFADVTRFALHRGIRDRFDAAGMSWPPTPAALSLAKRASAERDGAASQGSSAAPARHRVRNLIIAGLAVASIVVIIGGYAGHWAWTGFEANGQVWDWMHLLLLPVAFGVFSLWLRHAQHMTAERRRALGTGVLAFIAFVLAGYLAPLVWSGFRGQRLWDWLTLIVLPLTLTTVRAWPSTGRQVRSIHKIGATSLLVGFVVTLIGGYALGWSWTGYQGNLLWDWLQLLLAPIAIHTFLVPRIIKMTTGNVAEQVRDSKAREARAKALNAARERLGEVPS